VFSFRLVEPRLRINMHANGQFQKPDRIVSVIAPPGDVLIGPDKDKSSLEEIRGPSCPEIDAQKRDAELISCGDDRFRRRNG
jgi:hypothetical protein